jgi:hypothetical protein
MEKIIRIDYLTKIVIKNLKERNVISIDDIIEINKSEQLLPNNRMDAYFYLNKLIALKVLIKIKNGKYEVDQKVIGGIINEN